MGHNCHFELGEKSLTTAIEIDKTFFPTAAVGKWIAGTDIINQFNPGG